MDYRMDLKPKEIPEMLDYNKNVKKLAPKSFHSRAYELIQEIERRNALELKNRQYNSPDRIKEENKRLGKSPTQKTKNKLIE
jgi:hypothetical protein